VGEPEDPSRTRMLDWPQLASLRGRAGARSPSREGSPLPRIADLIMAHVEGTAAEKLAWLRAQIEAGKLDAEDPQEVAEAEALLAMLMRVTKGREGRDRHVDALLDEGLKGTFPASDPVTVGRFTATEAPGRPIDTAASLPTPRRRVRREKRAAKAASGLRRFG
jgi:hypothetical protein